MAVGTDQHTDGAELVLGVGLRSPPKGGEVVLSRSDESQHGGTMGESFGAGAVCGIARGAFAWRSVDLRSWFFLLFPCR